MTPGEFAVLLALVGYAAYRQARVNEVVGATRFRPAVGYGVIGLVAGGLDLPRGVLSWVLVAIGFVLSAIVGMIRTRVWSEGGHIYTQGTPATIAIFLALVVSASGLGAIAGAAHAGGIGTILLMIAIMVAVQAEIVWRRAQQLGVKILAGRG